MKLTHTSSSQILYIVQVYSWCGGDELLLINAIVISFWDKLSFTSLVSIWWTVYLIFYSWQLPISTQISSFLTILLILHVNCRLEWKERRQDWFRRRKIGWMWKNLPNSSFLKQFVFVVLVRTQWRPNSDVEWTGLFMRVIQFSKYCVKRTMERNVNNFNQSL